MGKTSIALIVGIDHYQHGSPLHGCVNDAHSVHAVMARNADGSINFSSKLLTASSDRDAISKRDLREALQTLFSTKAETALFYFAGHGHIEATGGYLMTSDAAEGSDGISLAEVMIWANESHATNKIIILDSCHSGIAGNAPGKGEQASLCEGLTILTASAKDQYATEKHGRGVFTTLLVDALSGGAANLVGEITPGSIYAHIDQSLGAWEQRPIFKTNVRNFVSLRTVQPPIALADLQLLTTFFPTPGAQFDLDPSFEPEIKGRSEGMPSPNEANTKLFAILQRYNRLNLLVPVDAPHMWHAAMESKSCRLTALGEHYRRLVEEGHL